MNPSEASNTTKLKVGIFTIGGLLLIGAVTVLVNDKPYWWRPCQLVNINVEDATGLKAKSSVRSLGLEIGYLQSVILSETHVQLGICITEKVEVLSSTRAYIRSEGFLGDKFVELKPVKYLGPGATQTPAREPSSVLEGKPQEISLLRSVLGFFVPEAQADESAHAADAPKTDKAGRQIPVGEGSQDMQNLVKRVDSLVEEMTSLTHHLKDALSPEDLRSTMKQLNRTLENASKTLAPEGGLTQTAQRTLAKLEDSIDQLRDLATRINQGQGSLGMLLNDPSYAEEIREVIKNANKLLSKVGNVRFIVDIGGEKINGYETGRGWFKLGIWPARDRYYLLGLSTDPRGRRTVLTTTTTAGAVTSTTQTTQVEQTGILITGMIGKVLFQRLDLSIGALNGDGAVSAGVFLGPRGLEDIMQLRFDLYFRGTENPTDGRATAIARIWKGVYVKGGLESFHTVAGVTPWSVGAGITFEDEDIKLLFALR